MRLFTVPSRPIVRFDSTGVTMDLLPGVLGTAQVNVAHIATGGTIGRHPTHHRQLLALVSGTARVQADDAAPVEIGPGTLVVWESGEVHQTWAVTDLLAVIVESVGVFDFAGRFPEVLATADDGSGTAPRPAVERL